MDDWSMESMDISDELDTVAEDMDFSDMNTDLYTIEESDMEEEYEGDLSGDNNDCIGDTYDSINEYESNGYFYEINDNDQITRAYGDLRLEDGERNSYAQRLAGGEFRRENDDGGHLIGARFGGSGEFDNLVPEDKTVNRGSFKSLENYWANELQSGNSVHVDIEPYYKGESLRPDIITAQTEINGDKNHIDYYSITNEDLESDEFELPDDADEMLDLYPNAMDF